MKWSALTELEHAVERMLAGLPPSRRLRRGWLVFVFALVLALVLLLVGCSSGRSTPAAAPPAVSSFQVDDAMWSWWTNPKLLRDTATNRTYVTFTQTDGQDGLAIYDHGTGTTKRYVLGTSQFLPDDHGAGSVVVGDGRVAAFLQGRDIVGDIYPIYYVEFGQDEDPTGLPLRSIPFSKEGVLNCGSNYPNTYNADGQFFLLARLCVDLGYQWGVVLSTWPLTQFSPMKVFYASEKYTWPYFATKRTSDSEVVAFALGFHPFSSDHHDIYYGEIRRRGLSAESWDVVSAGAVVGNLTSGAGLPFDESSFEAVYHAASGERTRLFDVGKDSVAFATFGADNIARYKYARRSASGWSVRAVVEGGLPFQGIGVRNYYGGMAISVLNPGLITLSREDNGTWLVERYLTMDGGATWALIASKAYPNNVVAARPMDEQLANGSAPVADLETMYWFGYYDYADYTKFSTTLTTF